MLRWIAPAAAGLLTAAGAMAQPAPPDRGPPPQARLFISPMGEPFREGEGVAAWFARADEDGDTLLTLEEFRADAERFFRVLDADGDGVIDGFENQAYERDIAPEIASLGELRGGGPGMAGAGPGGRPPGRSGGEGGPPRKGSERGGGKGGQRGEARQGAGRYSLLNIPQPVRGADADLNSRVTWEEWSQAARRRFQLLDQDGDGVLTLDTLPPPPGRPEPPARP